MTADPIIVYQIYGTLFDMGVLAVILAAITAIRIFIARRAVGAVGTRKTADQFDEDLIWPNSLKAKPTAQSPIGDVDALVSRLARWLQPISADRAAYYFGPLSLLVVLTTTGLMISSAEFRNTSQHDIFVYVMMANWGITCISAWLLTRSLALTILSFFGYFGLMLFSSYLFAIFDVRDVFLATVVGLLGGSLLTAGLFLLSKTRGWARDRVRLLALCGIGGILLLFVVIVAHGK